METAQFHAGMEEARARFAKSAAPPPPPAGPGGPSMTLLGEGRLRCLSGMLLLDPWQRGFPHRKGVSAVTRSGLNSSLCTLDTPGPGSMCPEV